MSGDVIKSFLVGLGFGVDDASLAKFNKAISSASLKVTALYASTKLAAAGIVYGISKISEGFEQLGYEYRIIAPAINKALVLRRELLKAYSAAGINITKVVQASVKLNMSIAKTKFALEAIYKSVGSRFFGLLTKQSDIFRQKLYQNMPKILNALEKFVKFVFKAFEATTALGARLWSILSRVWDFFVMLDKATDGWSTRVLALIAAWQLLNLEFLATPLGMIITGLIAILALFDDFKTWQEGGESLFDWSSFVPVINAVSEALKSTWEILKDITDAVGNLILAFSQLYQGDTNGFWESMDRSGRAIVKIFFDLWETIKGVASSMLAIGSWGANLFGGQNAAANIQNNPAAGGRPLANPIGTNVSNAQTNQHVEQQTNITVQGTADATAAGAAVASQQSKVNFDLVRNMKGATR